MKVIPHDVFPFLVQVGDSKANLGGYRVRVDWRTVRLFRERDEAVTFANEIAHGELYVRVIELEDGETVDNAEQSVYLRGEGT